MSQFLGWLALCGLAVGTALAQPTTVEKPDSTDIPGKTEVKWSGQATAFAIPDADAPFLDFKSAWPRRLTSPNAENSQRSGPCLILPESRLMWAPYRVEIGFGPEDGLEQLKAWLGDGIPAKFEREGSGAFVPKLVPANDEQRSSLEGLGILFISARTPLPADEASEFKIERTAFVVQRPLGETAVSPRGLALFMPGLFGTPVGVIEQTVKRLRRSGWVVVRMMSQPSRFTERVDFTIDLNADLASSVKAISEETAQRTAECAYSAQAACAEAERIIPELKRMPRIAMGFSGGAMTLPTVVAREPERYAAAIMIGGGADFWLLTARSNYTRFIDAARVSWTGRDKTAADERAVDDLYLRTSPLDSFHTAAALSGIPVLMIIGANDLAVPTALGEVLWKRLGEPHVKSEKWIRPGGHEVLFMNLRRDYENITSWIDRAVPRTDAEVIPSIPAHETEVSRPGSK